MDFATLETCCLGFPGAERTFPFGEEVVVYKVGGKMFALAAPGNTPLTVNLKCDPARALALRDEFPAITPGYHMNKEHWNTVRLDGSVPVDVVMGLVDHSYQLVLGTLRKADRERIGTL